MGAGEEYHPLRLEEESACKNECACILVKSLRETKGGDVHGNVSLGERLGICGRTNSLIVLLLRQHSVCVLKLRRLVIDSIDPGLESAHWMLQRDQGAGELWITGESNWNNRNGVLTP